jgi:hypothetical protein
MAWISCTMESWHLGLLSLESAVSIKSDAVDVH